MVCLDFSRNTMLYHILSKKTTLGTSFWPLSQATAAALTKFPGQCLQPQDGFSENVSKGWGQESGDSDQICSHELLLVRGHLTVPTT